MAGAFEKRNQSGKVKFFLRVRATSITAYNPALCCLFVAIVCAINRQACFILTEDHPRGCSSDRCMPFLQEDPGRVVLHPGSVYSDEKEHAHLYLVYFEKALTTQLYIRDATFANPYSILVRLCANVSRPLTCAHSICAHMVAAIWWRHHRATRARNNHGRQLDCLQCRSKNCCACEIDSYGAGPPFAKEDRAARD